MAIYSMSVETTSNATAGAAADNVALQFLMPAAREARLLRVTIQQLETAAGEHWGRWVVDRISAVGSGSSLTPLKASEASPASAITDATKTISTTLAATNTTANEAIVELVKGENLFGPAYGLPEIRSGVNKGFAIRRATAPTGSRVVIVSAMWEEL